MIRGVTSAEGRSYGYNIENWLTQVSGAGPTRDFGYDGNGALRWAKENDTLKTHFVAPEHQVNPVTGEATVYCRGDGEPNRRTVSRTRRPRVEVTFR
ncbi:MAG: hypothetical protein HYY04_16315 [Chloroflexi bacterium]|nr:hypothetical protein [Chloroflexota bacterium]